MVNSDDDAVGKNDTKEIKDMIAQLSLTVAKQAETTSRLEEKLDQAIAAITAINRDPLDSAAAGDCPTDGAIDDDSNATPNSTARSCPKKTASKKKKKNKVISDSEDDKDEEDVHNTTFIYETDSEEESGGATQGPTYRPHIEIEEFNFGDEEEVDWTSWVKKFQACVQGACNPRNAKEHHKYNLRWLPTKLNIAAHDVFLNCRYRNDWSKLLKELEDAFDNSAVKQRWGTDFKAYTWDERQPLHVYRGNVIRYVNKYDSELRKFPKAMKKAYYRRYVSGLPDDYVDFIEQRLYDDKQTIDHALKVSQQFQISKQRSAGKHHQDRDSE